MKRRYCIFVYLILPVLFFLTPHSAYASDVDLEKDLQRGLEDSVIVIKQAQEKLRAGLAIAPEINQLKNIAEEIKASHLLLQERFRIREDRIKTLGAKADERHRIMSEGYSKALEEYLSLIENLPVESATPQSAIDNLQSLLNRILHKKKRPILGSLPYRNLNYPAKEPNTNPPIKPAYKGGNKTVSPEDLKGAEEAPISQEIAEFAQSLNWKPVAIYEYVKNNIKTEWYWGCQKGAEETLKQGSGNDCDQASLLIALFRASGFPSRYVRGTIEFFAGGRDGVPMEKIKNLTGIQDPQKIAEFFQKAGIPYKPIIAGGKISNFQIEHVWVESRIPYGNYRGTMIDDSDPTWLGLDTSIKPKGYTYTPSFDILSDTQLAGLRDIYLNTVNTLTPLEYVKASLEGFLAQRHPGMTYNDLLSTRSIIPEDMKILPASMQFIQKKITHEYTEIPEELMHKVRFTASRQDTADSIQDNLFDITLDTMKLSNQQIALSYEPETVEDQAIIDSYGGLDNTPSYLVRLRPVLLINGERIIVAKDGLPMGADYNLTIELISPNGMEKISSTQITGNLLAIGITAQNLSTLNIPSPPAGEGEGEGGDNAENILFKEAMNYIDRWNQAEDELASLTHVVIARPIPTVVTIGGVIDVTYLLDMPHGFEWKGVFVDAALRSIEVIPSPLAGEGVGEGDRQKTFMQLSALQGSVLENRVFEDDFQVESISTAKLLQLCTLNSELCTQIVIDKTNIDTILPTLAVDDNIKEDIINSVNQNLTIRIPLPGGQAQSEITYQDWSGIGYIKENLETGESGYMLSGMIAGGMTVINPGAWTEQDLANKLGKPFSKEPSKGPAAYIVKIKATDRQEGTVGQQLKNKLAVFVSDSGNKPVKGTAVTFKTIAGGGYFTTGIEGMPIYIYEAISGNDGIAEAPFILGMVTNTNPVYNKYDGDEFVTQVGLNLVTASVSTPFGAISMYQPFEAYAKPDIPKEIIKVLGDGNTALVNNPAGSLVAKVVDKFGNSISNINITFKTTNTQSREINVPLPDEYRTLQFYKKEECSNLYPLYGDCSTVGEITIKTEYFGAITSTMIGDTVNTEYTVEARSAGLPSVTYALYSDGFRNKDDYIPPGLYIKYLIPVNDKGEPVNASKAGTELKAPLVSELFMLHDDYKMEGPYPCTYNAQINCYKLKLGGIAKTQKITNGTITFTPVQGGGISTQTENIGSGQYRTKYTTGSQPAVNRIEASGEAVITAPEVLFDPFVTGILVPSFSGTPNQYYDPLTKIAITEYPENKVQCSNGECKLMDQQAMLKSGQQAIFYSDGPVIAGIEQKANYTVYGVNIEMALEPKYIITNEDGFTAMDTTLKYNILPAEYNAIIADIDLYGMTGSGTDDWLGYMAVDKTQGQGTGTYIAGSQFDINKEYSSEVVLNRGSDVEIKGDRLQLPIGQFKMVTDDTERTPVYGSVTDGTAKIKLQLIVKNNKEAFTNLLWRIIDPQLIDPFPSTIQGTLMDGDNQVDSLPVTFIDDTAEAVYRAPESFVRWQTVEEDDDKDRPYRYIQPTLDIVSYFQNMKDPLPQIALRRTPVVLVHGLWGDRYAWDEFEPEFNNDGIYDINRVDYHEDGQVSSITKHAKTLRSDINTMLKKTTKELKFAARKVDIIAHSMGGLLTREYCQQFNSECQNKIRRFITIATPHYGSELADLLLVYRDINTRDLFSTNEKCLRSVDSFVRGGKIKVVWPFEKSVEPHPIDPVLGAIDDLATGNLPQQIPPGLIAKGRWDTYPPLSITLSAHAIEGVTPQGVDGYDLRIWGLWQLVLRRCGFTPENVFPDGNDRIVRVWSQRGGLASDNTSLINETDHFTVRNWPETIEEIKLLLDEPLNSTLFSK